jgi:hypothetical protein
LKVALNSLLKTIDSSLFDSICLQSIRVVSTAFSIKKVLKEYFLHVSLFLSETTGKSKTGNSDRIVDVRAHRSGEVILENEIK